MYSLEWCFLLLFHPLVLDSCIWLIIENYSSNYMADTSEQQPPNNVVAVSLFTRFIATGFFSGYSPFVPGTAGSLVGLAMYYVIPWLDNPLILPAAVLVTFFLGVRVSAELEKHLGNDPQIVVIDEIVGMWISLILLPPKPLWIALLAFFFFRVYDIFKPPPARYLERFKHGWGIMLDDVAAGVYANLTVRLILFFVGTPS